MGRVDGSNERMSHLLCTDDTIIFCGADTSQLGYLRCILLCLETGSGFNVNYVKSEISPVGKAGNVGSLASVVGFKVGDVASTFWVCHLGPLPRLRQSGALWWKDFRRGCRGERSNICQMGGGLRL